MFTIAFIIDNYWYSSSSAKYLRKHIEQDIQTQEKDFDKILKDTALVQRLVTQQYAADELTDLTEPKKTYCIFLYALDEPGNNALKFWNSQLVLPDKELLSGNETNELVKLRNGQYECIRRQISLSGASHSSNDG